MRRAAGDWLGVVCLALLPFLVFGRFIALGDELFNADVFLAYRPAHAWLAEGLRRANVPLWNPYILGGFPIAFTEYGWFSPLNWLPLALFGGHAGFYAAVALYVALAGLATYGLAQCWELSRAAALLAGMVFSQSLYVVGGAPLLNQAAAYWALPALLWCVAAHFGGSSHQSPRAAPAFAAVLALMLLGSHPQLAVIVLAPVTAFALGSAWRTRRAAPLLPLAIAAVLAASISAVRLLPTLPLLAASERSGGLTYAASAIGSVRPLGLLAGMAFPSLSVPRVLSPQWASYVGPLPLLLCGVTLHWAWPRGWRHKHEPGNSHPHHPPLLSANEHGWRQRVPWLVCLGSAGVLLTFGSYSPLYRLIAETPLLAYFREPSRFLLWTVLAISLLAAKGLDLFISGGRREPIARTVPPPGMWRRAVTGFILLCAAFAVAHVGLRAAEARILGWGHARALSQVVGRSYPGDYPPEHYLATFDAAWRQTLRATNPLHPGLLVPLLSLLAALWWWQNAQHTGRRRAARTALLCAALPLVTYGQLRLPAIPAATVQEMAATQERIAGAATVLAEYAGAPIQPSPPLAPRIMSWLPLAADYEMRLQVEAHAQPAAADMASYRLLMRLLAPNAGITATLPHVDGYENLMTRPQRLLAAALGSERAVATTHPPSTVAGDSTAAGDTSDIGLSHLGIQERRRRLGQRWNVLIAAGGGILLSTERLQPETWPAVVRYEPAIVPRERDLPALNGFRVAHPLPRAFLATQWIAVDSPEAAIRELMARVPTGGLASPVISLPHDENDAWLLQGAAATVQRDPQTPQVSPAGSAPVLGAHIVRYAERIVEVETDAPTDALLILLDAIAPGWAVTVSESAATLLTANVGFRAVRVPAGRHLVRFTYTPPLWREALAITALGVTGTAMWTLWPRSMRHTPRPRR